MWLGVVGLDRLWQPLPSTCISNSPFPTKIIKNQATKNNKQLLQRNQCMKYSAAGVCQSVYIHLPFLQVLPGTGDTDFNTVLIWHSQDMKFQDACG